MTEGHIFLLQKSITNFSARVLLQTATWQYPSGKPASYNILTKLIHDNGVVDAGLMITGAPTAIAGIVW